MKKFTNSGQFKPTEISIGAKYNAWIVVGSSDKTNSGGNTFWECRCKCGSIKHIAAHSVVSGKSQSCGCYRRRKGQNKKHGLRNHPLYGIWRGIKYRCLTSTAHNYADYGGRGIKICDRWMSVENFYNDVIYGYEKGLQLGRIDNDGDYEPGNCQWETPLINVNNRRNTVYVTFDGRTHTPAQWSKELQCKADTIRNRMRKGWSDYEALFGNS